MVIFYLFITVKLNRNRAPIVKKAFQILELIARADNRMSISDISQRVGISAKAPSMVSLKPSRRPELLFVMRRLDAIPWA